MSNILTIGYTGEGSTDEKFLGNIIRRTFEELAFDCSGQIEVFEPQFIKVSEQGFVDQVLEAARIVKFAHVLCIHSDADAETNENVFNFKINPASKVIEDSTEEICKNIVPIVPIHMTESWMLADMQVLLDEIGTTMTPVQLQLPSRVNQMELIPDPKFALAHALNIAQDNFHPNQKISLSDLYSPLSQKIPLKSLRQLNSYNAFAIACRGVLRSLNYMH